MSRWRSEALNRLTASRTLTPYDVDKFREAHQRFTARLPKLSLHYYYATLGSQVHPNTQRQVDSLKAVVTVLFECRLHLRLHGCEATTAAWAERADRAHAITLARTLFRWRTASSLVSIPAYFDFITQDDRFRSGLFDANVRDYQGNVEVNPTNRQTFDSPEGEDFWWLNNGVTIIAREAHHSGKSLTIREPHVVNVRQASHETFSALSLNTERR